MTDLEALKQAVCDRIDVHAEQIAALSQRILESPETGYREFGTAALVADQLDTMGLEPTVGLAGTGVKARMRGRSSNRTVAVLGELDSLLLPAHPYADPETGAAHACGHNAQVASMLGAGLGLQAVMDQLDGDVVLFAVPAEECIEVDWRLQRRDAGEIEFVVGKPELIKAGAFEDVDLAIITHASSDEGTAVRLDTAANGSLVKRVTFHGVAAHAGNSPDRGVNALKATTLAIAGIDAQRECFRDRDGVRVSHVITQGGGAVSAIPDEVRMEIMVRANTTDAIAAAAARVDRALRAGALALGAAVTIETVGGYLPYRPDAALVEVLDAACARELGAASILRSDGEVAGGSTDMGDLGMVMPVVHPMAACGSTAPFHGSGFWTEDHVRAAVVPAKFMATAIVDLLADGAARAEDVIERSGPKLSTADYLALRRSFDGLEHWEGAAH